MKEPVEDLLKASGVDLSNGAGFEEIEVSRVTFGLQNFCLMVWTWKGLRISGNSLSDKKFYLLYNADNMHYNFITNIKAAMAKKYMCSACDTLRGLLEKYPTVFLYANTWWIII